MILTNVQLNMNFFINAHKMKMFLDPLLLFQQILQVTGLKELCLNTIIYLN